MLDRDPINRPRAEWLAERATALARDLGACDRSDDPPPMLPVARRIADALAQTLRLIAAQLQPRLDARALREEAELGLLPPDAEERWSDLAARVDREAKVAAEKAAVLATSKRTFVDSGEVCTHCEMTRGTGRWARKLMMHWHCARASARDRRMHSQKGQEGEGEREA